MTETEFDLINELLSREKAADAKMEFNKITPDNSLKYWMIKGRIEQKFQNWGEALNAYDKVLQLDKSNSKAKNNIAIIRGILNFWNPEMFNP
ncbi:MAG: hypothetical protein ACOC11_03345 [Prolixibacteraceae bacterium]